MVVAIRPHVWVDPFSRNHGRGNHDLLVMLSQEPLEQWLGIQYAVRFVLTEFDGSPGEWSAQYPKLHALLVYRNNELYVAAFNRRFSFDDSQPRGLWMSEQAHFDTGGDKPSIDEVAMRWTVQQNLAQPIKRARDELHTLARACYSAFAPALKYDEAAKQLVPVTVRLVRDDAIIIPGLSPLETYRALFSCSDPFLDDMRFKLLPAVTDAPYAACHERTLPSLTKKADENVLETRMAA